MHDSELLSLVELAGGHAQPFPPGRIGFETSQRAANRKEPDSWKKAKQDAEKSAHRRIRSFRLSTRIRAPWRDSTPLYNLQ
jgi:hypothetical protein